jgi:hypothetical protein
MRIFREKTLRQIRVSTRALIHQGVRGVVRKDRVLDRLDVGNHLRPAALVT